MLFFFPFFLLCLFVRFCFSFFLLVTPVKFRSTYRLYVFSCLPKELCQGRTRNMPCLPHGGGCNLGVSRWTVVRDVSKWIRPVRERAEDSNGFFSSSTNILSSFFFFLFRFFFLSFSFVFSPLTSFPHNLHTSVSFLFSLFLFLFIYFFVLFLFFLSKNFFLRILNRKKI